MEFFKKFSEKKNQTTKKKIREFILKDYDDTYILPNKLLVYIGLRLLRKDSPFVKSVWIAIYCFECFNLFIPIILNLMLLRELKKSGDFDVATKLFRMIPCVGYMVLAMLKTYKVVYKRSVFENLILELRSMWPEGPLTEEEYCIITKAMDKINFLVKGYYYCNTGLTLSVVIPEWIYMVRRAMGHDIPRILPYIYYIPFDTDRPGIFEFVMVVQCWQTMATVWFILLGDLLFCIFLSHITIQLDLLCVRIKRMIYVPVDQQLVTEYPLGQYEQEMPKEENDLNRSISCAQRNMKIEKELANIVIRHTALIRLAGDIENIFSFSLLVNFFYSSLCICFCGFCSVLIEKWNEFMYKTFLLTALTQTWLLCWYGQKLLDSSLSVADALYNCGWYTASIGVRKSILIMIHRSQKSVHITTYGFSIICLASFTSIIKTAWSYFNLLLTTYDVN